MLQRPPSSPPHPPWSFLKSNPSKKNPHRRREAGFSSLVCVDGRSIRTWGRALASCASRWTRSPATRGQERRLSRPGVGTTCRKSKAGSACRRASSQKHLPNLLMKAKTPPRCPFLYPASRIRLDPTAARLAMSRLKILPSRATPRNSIPVASDLVARSSVRLYSLFP